MKRRSRPKAARYRSFARRASIFIILISVVLLFTWDYLRSAFLGALISVGRGQAGVLEDKVSGEAVFAGGSATVIAPAPGSVKFLVKDRESVRMGQVIAEVSGQATAQAFQESLAFAGSQLAEYERTTDTEFNALVSRIQPAYEKCVDILFRIHKAYASRDVPAAQAEEKRLLDAEKGISGDRARLSAIEDQRAKLSINLANIVSAQKASTVQVLAPASGTFYVEVAPAESRFTYSALAGKDATQLMALSREAMETRPSVVKDGQTVNAGDPIGRVVSGQKVAFFLPVKTEEKPDIKPGRQVTVSFASPDLFEEAVITGVQDGKPPGYSVIAGEIPVMPVDRVVRSGSICLVVASRSGIVVPRSAILTKDGKTGVLAVQKTYARFVPVDVLMAKGEEAVVRGIAPGDELVMRAIGFLEGKRVR